MPANTPNRGYPYPLPDDAIADYPALGRSLAEQLDGELVLPPGNAAGDVLTWSGSEWVPVAGVATVSAPTPTVAPTFVGPVNAGATVTRGAGVWAGNPVPGVTWEWLLNDVQAQLGGDTYTLPADSSGKTLKLREHATNSIGTGSSEVASAVNVGIQGSWEATRTFLDQNPHQGASTPGGDGTWYSLPWASNPDNAGDAATTPAVLVADQWGKGLTDALTLPAVGTYRFEYSFRMPNDWNVGYSGDAGGRGSRLLIGGVAYAQEQNNNENMGGSIDIPGLAAGASAYLQMAGGATGKSPRPNNIRLRITHLA